MNVGFSLMLGCWCINKRPSQLVKGPGKIGRKLPRIPRKIRKTEPMIIKTSIVY
jgi:hypothetical protein